MHKCVNGGFNPAQLAAIRKRSIARHAEQPPGKDTPPVSGNLLGLQHGNKETPPVCHDRIVAECDVVSQNRQGQLVSQRVGRLVFAPHSALAPDRPQGLRLPLTGDLLQEGYEAGIERSEAAGFEGARVPSGDG
jgi:hypothetical protein